MWKHFTVERTSLAALSREVWSFMIIDEMVVLDEYSRQSRETRRHKFRADERYVRLAGAHSYSKVLSEDEVPTPEDVFDEALATARAQLKVGLWRRDFDRR